MGYINIPKLVGGDTPIVTPREMPDDWKYFSSLKEHANDQAYLFFSDAADLFYFTSVSSSTIYVYGGSNGTTPLYKWVYGTGWYRYENGSWVQSRVTTASTCDLREADTDNYPLQRGLHFSNLIGKQVTNDPNIGTTQLFTVIVHKNDNSVASSYLNNTFAPGSNNGSGAYMYPLVAYSGYTNGISYSGGNLVKSLEFIEFTGYNDYISGELTYLNTLQKLELPSSATLMPLLEYDYFLLDCNIPSTINSLNTNQFRYCTSLGNVKLHSGITSLPENCFNNCYSLKKVSFPNITTVSNSVFAYCFALEEVDLPNATSIGNYVFQECRNLKKVTLNNNITTLSNNCFSNCYSLKYLTLPTSLTQISDNVFMNCYLLQKIDIPSTVSVIGGACFSNCVNLSEIAIPNSVTAIQTQTFNNCQNLKKITLGNSITSIANNAFYQCTSLKEINLPDTLQTIGQSAFYQCKNIEYFEIPASVTTLSSQTFGFCGGVYYYKMKGLPPSFPGINTFNGINNYTKILVPYDYIADYQTATNWVDTSLSFVYRQRGYKTFNQGDTLLTTDSTGNYSLTWYEKLDDILNTTATSAPSVTPITIAPSDGEFYCTIQSVL